MRDPRKVARDFTDRLVRTGEPWIDRQPAALGNYQREVRVPGSTNQVYARANNGQVVKVFNNVAPNIYDWRVYIGRDKQQPTLHKVIDVRWMYNIGRTLTYIAFHHTQHEYPNPDTVWVRRDQFMPLLVLPATGLTVQLYGDVIYHSGMPAPLRVDNELIDLSSYASAGGAYYLLIEIDNTGEPNIVQGDTYGSLVLLRENAPLPVPTAGSFPVAAIEMYEGQTSIRRDSTQRNIIDLRMFTSDVVLTPGDQISTAEEYNTISDGDKLGFLRREDGNFYSISYQNFVYRMRSYVEHLYASILKRITNIFNGEWTFDTSTTMSDPGSGNIRSNGVTGDVSTQLAFSTSNSGGMDASLFLSGLDGGDIILIQEHDNADKWIRFSVTSTPTDNTTWFLVPVSFESSSGTGQPAKNTSLFVQFTYLGPGGGGGGATDLDDLTDVVITAPAVTEVLTYNGTEWVNSPATGGGGGTPWTYDNLTSQIPAASDDYTLTGTPAGDVIVFWNSTFQTDFTVTGTTLSLNFSPTAGDELVALYDMSGTFVEPSASPALRIYMNQNFTM